VNETETRETEVKDDTRGTTETENEKQELRKIGLLIEAKEIRKVSAVACQPQLPYLAIQIEKIKDQTIVQKGVAESVLQREAETHLLVETRKAVNGLRIKMMMTTVPSVMSQVTILMLVS
jgi:peroxiredoxin family protein